MRISLDVEGVLADSHGAARKRSDRLTEDNCPPSNWSFANEDHLDHYLHVTQNLWHNHNELIEPCEPFLDNVTERLSNHHTVDIVTNRTGVDEQIQEWLDRHNIVYDEFHALRGNKTAFDHDVFVDDSPNVAEDVIEVEKTIFLIDRPYNQEIGYPSNGRRVSTVFEVGEVLTR